MGYPDDQGKPGGWPPVQSPQAPYGSGPERPGKAPYGLDDDKDESPFAPRGESFGGPGGATASWGDDFAEPAAFSGSPGASQFSNEPSYDDDRGGPGGSTSILGAPTPGAYAEPGSFGSPGLGSGGPGSGGSGGPGSGGPGDTNAFGDQHGFGEPSNFSGSNDAGGFGGPGGGFGGPGGGPGGGFGDQSHDAEFGTPVAGEMGSDFGHGGPGGPGGQNGPVQPERRYNLPLIIGGAVAAGLVLIGGGFGVSAMLKDDSPKKKPAAQSSTPAPKQSQQGVAPTPKPNLAPVKLKLRTTDPKALTAGEIFAKSKFGPYVRTAAKAQTSCTGAVSGSSLASILKKAGCSQVVRGTYARKDGKLIGTVGVLNLRSENAAKVVLKIANGKDSYLVPLPGTGTTKKIGKGEALGTAETRGHYLIMTWVQRPDGKKIDDKYHSSVSAFGQQVIKGSGLTFALAYRETEGKPFRN
ncbi:hypothetical protein J4573_34555 [Actinomadura barringtoniae]|uniref:Uncharacterized protein n=1 Tax=Actinomadura barringtoniae TaxID=1427535 RepID=A0A939PGU7_9ACTN|nr:hypothetical protein [Actinomadura barringtoniae]MBO2452255.1 hypothetical protein [Actinomadura barringtoniae]